MTKIIKLSILTGILLALALWAFLPRKVLSEKSEPIEMNVRIYHERPDIKTYAKEKVGEEWGDDQWIYFYKIIDSESSWVVNKEHYPDRQYYSTAFGFGGFLDSTWGTVGCVKTDDVYSQIDCTILYIKNRKSYGNPEKAWNFHVKNNWY